MKSKKAISILTVLAMVVSVLSSPMLFTNASTVDPVGLGLEDDAVYYIMNYSRRLLAPMSDDSSLYVEVGTWDEREWQLARVKWKIDKQNDGSIKIRSFSGTGNYLRGYTDSMTVEVECDENDSSVRFEIERVELEAYKGMYTIKCGDYYITQTGESLVTLTESTTDRSYWTFMAVEKRDAGLYANNSSEDNWLHINPTTFLNNFLSYGYGAYYLENFEGPQYIPQHLIENDITIFAGKSSQASVDFYKYDSGIETFIGSFTADYETSRSRQNQYYAFDLEPNSLCGSRCIIYLGSYTGVTYNDYNLVDITYEKGAHYVLGFESYITDSQKGVWLETFCTYIDQSMNIEYSVGKANESAQIDADDVYFRGDGRQYLNF